MQRKKKVCKKYGIIIIGGSMKNKKLLIIPITSSIIVILATTIFFNVTPKTESSIKIKSDNVEIQLNLDKDNKIIDVSGDNNELQEIKGKSLEETTSTISEHIAKKTDKEKVKIEIEYTGNNNIIDDFKEDLEKKLEEKNIEVEIITEEKSPKKESNSSNTTNNTNNYNCSINIEYDETTYDGNKKEPNVQVICDNEELKNNIYTVSYKNNTNAGTAKVIVKINGKYKTEITKNFTINKEVASIGNCTNPKNNGSNQNIIAGGIGVTYSNNIKKDPGNYEVKVTLDSNYKWSDSSTEKTKKVSCSINMTSNNRPIEAYFINTTNPSKKMYSNEAILLVTKEGKTVVIDTSDNQDYPNIIYTYLKQIQNISHAHTDHYYGLKYINNTNDYNNKIKIKNIYYKANTQYEIKEGLTSLINSLKNKGIIEKVNQVNSMPENSIINIDTQNSLHLFNLKDVFAGLDCNFAGTTMKGYGLRKYSSNKSSSDLLCSNPECNKYYYINIDEPHTIKKDLEYNNYNPNGNWYIYKKNVGAQYLCNENTNSIAILVESKTTNGSKYIYIPNDLENNVYSPIGEYNKWIANEWYSSSIYGNGWYLYDDSFNMINTICTSANKCVDVSKYKIASESRVANKICNLLTNNNCKDTNARENLKNIVIYQQSHHGYNNVLDVVNTLRLNRTELYSIITTSGTAFRDKTTDFNIARTCAKNSKNTKMRSTGSTVSGFPNNSVGAVRCFINYDGTALCDGNPVCDNKGV